MQLGRWKRLLTDRDDSRVWIAICWKGELAGDNGDKSCPSSDEFKAHFESILNVDTDNDDVEINTNVTILVLDEQISFEEVQEQITRTHPDKACGQDGLPSGVFSLLPFQWVLTNAALFNNVFLWVVLIRAHGLQRKFSLYTKKVVVT